MQTRSSSPSNIKAQFRYTTKRFLQGSAGEAGLQKVPPASPRAHRRCAGGVTPSVLS